MANVVPVWPVAVFTVELRRTAGYRHGLGETALDGGERVHLALGDDQRIATEARITQAVDVPEDLLAALGLSEILLSGDWSHLAADQLALVEVRNRNPEAVSSRPAAGTPTKPLRHLRVEPPLGQCVGVHRVPTPNRRGTRSASIAI